MPELILHAVTESASVKACHKNGTVIWSAAALHNLSYALGCNFAHVANDPEFRTQFIKSLLDLVNKGEDYEREIAPKLILFTLLKGTGCNFDEVDYT